MPALRADSLCLARGDRVLLRGLSLHVAPGAALHVQGRNGVGKTTLLETLCGLRQPESGTIAERPEPEALHWLGHRNALNLALSPRENLAFWCGVHGSAVGSAAMDAALARLGLGAAADRPCGRLSTGQKRRAALARLLALPRAWWFLDEPLAGLDQAGVALFGTLLGGHLAGGGAAVFTSHQGVGEGLPVRALALA